MAEEPQNRPESPDGDAAESSDSAVERIEEAPTWEVVLARAEREAAPSADAPATASGARAARPWALWLRAAVPLLILLVYAGYKIGQRPPRDPRPMQVEQIASITGVAPGIARVRLSREAESLAADLEYLRQSGDWGGIRRRVEAADETLRQNEVIEAFHLIALAKTGAARPAMRTRLRALQPIFQDDRARRGLYEHLLLAEAEVLLRFTNDPADCLRHADFFRTALQRQTAVTQEVIDFRIRLAERYLAAGDTMMEEAGRFRVDRSKLSDARALYQNAMRWVTRPDGWRTAEPIATGRARAARDRVTLKLSEANRRFHGPVMPLTGRDNTTWSGNAGDPVHDLPGGTW